MKSIITAKVQFNKQKDNNYEEGEKDYGVAEIDYTNNNAGDFGRYIDLMYNHVSTFIQKVSSANELRIDDAYLVIKGYNIKFLRDDGTIVDEITITNETIDGVKELVTAFYTI